MASNGFVGATSMALDGFAGATSMDLDGSVVDREVCLAVGLVFVEESSQSPHMAIFFFYQ
jgi:hypothetical protein